MSQQTTNRYFDELAKGLATGTLSRGKALRWMGGALLGAALASVPGVAWANDCRSLGRECRRDSQCCSKNCVRRGDDKVCACPEGKTRCNDRCVNLNRNENHCGSCFNPCEEGEECVGGVCQGGQTPGCTPGAECGTCVRPGGDIEPCFCWRSADGTSDFCGSAGGRCVNSCAECVNTNLPVCVQGSEPPCELVCVAPCRASDGETCGGSVP